MAYTFAIRSMPPHKAKIAKEYAMLNTVARKKASREQCVYAHAPKLYGAWGLSLLFAP